jgi:hypothetical protein
MVAGEGSGADWVSQHTVGLDAVQSTMQIEEQAPRTRPTSSVTRPVVLAQRTAADAFHHQERTSCRDVRCADADDPRHRETVPVQRSHRLGFSPDPVSRGVAAESDCELVTAVPEHGRGGVDVGFVSVTEACPPVGIDRPGAAQLAHDVRWRLGCGSKG